MIDQYIAEASRYVEHAGGLDMELDPALGSVYVIVVNGTINVMASNAITLARYQVNTNEPVTKRTFIPLQEGATNGYYHDKFLDILSSFDETLDQSCMLSNALLNACCGNFIKRISFNAVTITVNSQDIIKFCKLLPKDTKILIEAVADGTKRALKLSAQMPNQYIEQITVQI